MIFKKIATIALLIVFVFAFSACESKGPMEKIGDKIDKAVEKTGDKLEETGEAIEDAAEKAEKKVKKAVD